MLTVRMGVPFVVRTDEWLSTCTDAVYNILPNDIYMVGKAFDTPPTMANCSEQGQ